MEYESSKKRIPTNPSVGCTGNGIERDKRLAVEELLKQGISNRRITEQTGISCHTVRAIKKDMDDKGMFPHGTWRRNEAKKLSEIVSMGTSRLLDEIDDVPVGQLPLLVAIMTDKALLLQGEATVVTEHKVTVTHKDLNDMLLGQKDVVDLDEIPKDANDAKDAQD